MLPATFTVVVDANVLFPLTLRDTVLRAAAAGFYQLRWSAEILDEMERNLVSTGTVPADKAARLRATLDRFFPEAQVTDYEPLIPAMKNDPKDRHVVAAAVKAGAQVIATANLKDFATLPDGIEAHRRTRFSATCSISIRRHSSRCCASRPLIWLIRQLRSAICSNDFAGSYLIRSTRLRTTSVRGDLAAFGCSPGRFSGSREGVQNRAKQRCRAPR